MKELDLDHTQESDVILLPSTLQALNEEFLQRKGKGMSYDYSGGGFGGSGWGTSPVYNPSDGSYWLPDIVVTPTGNSVGDDWSNNWGNNWGNEWAWDHMWGDNNRGDNGDCGGGGGGSDSALNDATDIARGNAVIDFFDHAIQNNQVTYLEAKHTDKGIAVATAVSAAMNAHEISVMAIQAVKADQGIIKTMGQIASGTNVSLSTGIAIVGFSDGTVSASDWCTAASAFFGWASLGASFVCPPAGLVLDGVSVCLGFASLLVPGDNGTPGGMGNSSGY